MGYVSEVCKEFTELIQTRGERAMLAVYEDMTEQNDAILIPNWELLRRDDKDAHWEAVKLRALYLHDSDYRMDPTPETRDGNPPVPLATYGLVRAEASFLPVAESLSTQRDTGRVRGNERIPTSAEKNAQRRHDEQVRRTTASGMTSRESISTTRTQEYARDRSKPPSKREIAKKKEEDDLRRAREKSRGATGGATSDVPRRQRTPTPTRGDKNKAAPGSGKKSGKKNYKPPKGSGAPVDPPKSPARRDSDSDDDFDPRSLAMQAPTGEPAGLSTAKEKERIDKGHEEPAGQRLLHNIKKYVSTFFIPS